MSAQMLKRPDWRYALRRRARRAGPSDTVIVTGDRRLTFGQYPTFMIKAARGIAHDILSKVSKGADPARERRLDRHRKELSQANNWNDPAERYFALVSPISYCFSLAQSRFRVIRV